MTPQQALQFLSQVLITKPGMTVQECAAVVAAWNTVAEAIKPPDPQEQGEQTPPH